MGFRSGFCVVEELDDGTLQPGDLHAVVKVCNYQVRITPTNKLFVKPGHAAILQNLHDGRDMSEQMPMPFMTGNIAVSNMTGSQLRLALCASMNLA